MYLYSYYHCAPYLRQHPLLKADGKPWICHRAWTTGWRSAPGAEWSGRPWVWPAGRSPAAGWLQPCGSSSLLTQFADDTLVSTANIRPPERRRRPGFTVHLARSDLSAAACVCRSPSQGGVHFSRPHRFVQTQRSCEFPEFTAQSIYESYKAGIYNVKQKTKMKLVEFYVA